LDITTFLKLFDQLQVSQTVVNMTLYESHGLNVGQIFLGLLCIFIY